MRKYTLAFLALALLLSACRIESNILLDVSEDGSAIVGAEIGFDEEMLDLVSQGGGDPSDILGELPELGGENIEPIERVEGDMTYYGAQTSIDDLSTYDFDGLQGETFSEFSYEFDDSTATLAARVESTGIDDLGGEGLPIDPSEITGDIFSANVIVKMPGTVTEHNADEVRSDGSLVWKLSLTGTKEIFAAATFGESSQDWIWFIVGGVLLLGVIAAIAAVMASRKDAEKAVAEAAAAHEDEQEEELSAGEDHED
jgi:hypothetical protein